MHKPTHHKRSSRVGHWLPADRKVLNAWLAKTREAAGKKTAPVNPVILELRETIEGEYVHDPKAPFYGFQSWNDFFIRRFKPGTRPIAEPHNHKAIVSACESTPFAIATNVKAQDVFWIKSQPYSLKQMLDGHFVEHLDGRPPLV
jgi:Phosphatidylserine decarboxylase